MHYVRFLKPPRIELKKSKASIKALITITTDLGDDFLAADLEIFALVIRDETTISSKDFQWRSGMRALPIEILDIPMSMLKAKVMLLVSSKPDSQASLLSPSIELLPEIINAWSKPFNLHENDNDGGFDRRLVTSSNLTISIGEDARESIARHLW